MRRMLALFTVLVLTFAGVAIVPETAEATVPGAVGRIVFVSDRDHAYGEISTRSFSGGAWTRLTSDSATDTAPAWSPDGSQIAYTSDAAGSADIWVMNTDGSGKQNLTSDAFWNENPDWSPDGEQIVYARQKSGSFDWDVWVMRADGSGKTNLTSQAPGTTAFDPAWSPDGSKIRVRVLPQRVFGCLCDGSRRVQCYEAHGRRFVVAVRTLLVAGRQTDRVPVEAGRDLSGSVCHECRRFESATAHEFDVGVEERPGVVTGWASYLVHLMGW